VHAIEVGTGSGCIAITLAVRTPGLQIAATDISSAALGVAACNAARHNVAGRIFFAQADLLSPFRGPFDLICANLPYIPSAALDALSVNHHEPVLALDGGADGLRLLERLLAQAQTRLASGGCLLMEIESSLGSRSLDLARQYFPDAVVTVRKDLAGQDRLLEITR
jgi:release factor glutamine methyltransferase